MNFPFEFSYTLSSSEALEALKSAGVIKTSGIKRWIYTGIIILSVVLNLYTYFFKAKSGSFLMGAALCAVLLVIIWVYPERELRSRAERAATQTPVPAKVCEDRAEISEGESAWEIPFDGTFSFKESENFLLLFSKNDRIAAFPKKDIKAKILPDLVKFLAEKSTE